MGVFAAKEKDKQVSVGYNFLVGPRQLVSICMELSTNPAYSLSPAEVRGFLDAHK